MTWREFHQSLKEEMKQTISSVSLAVLQLIDKYLNHKNTIWDSWSSNFTVNISKGSFYEKIFFHHMGTQYFTISEGFYNGTRA